MCRTVFITGLHAFSMAKKNKGNKQSTSTWFDFRTKSKNKNCWNNLKVRKVSSQKMLHENYGVRTSQI